MRASVMNSFTAMSSTLAQMAKLISPFRRPLRCSITVLVDVFLCSAVSSYFQVLFVVVKKMKKIKMTFLAENELINNKSRD